MISMVEALQDQKYKVNILAAYKEEGEDYSLVEPLIIDPVSLSKQKAKEIATHIKPDIVIIRETKGGFKRVAKCAKSLGSEVIFYDQKPHFRKPGLFYWIRDVKNMIKRYLTTGAKKRITPVLGIKNGVPRVGSEFFYFPMKIRDGAKNRTYLKNGYPTILCVGKLAVPRKRHIWLIDALEEIEADCELIIAGAGDDSVNNPNRSGEYYQTLIKRANTSTIKHGVKVYENIPYAKMQELYLQADIFVLPSEKEPFAISPLEAMASGCVVISSDDNGSAGYIENGVNGYVIQNGSLDSLKSLLKYLLENKESLKNIGNNAYLKLEANHKYDSFSNLV